jgi:hypothetical protein
MEFDKTYRSFSGLEDNSPVEEKLSYDSIRDNDRLLSKLRNNILGSSSKFVSPFGQKQIIYADWTASGRALSSIENFVLEEILPHYGTQLCELQIINLNLSTSCTR